MAGRQEDSNWEETLLKVKRLIQGYLESGRYSEKMRALDGVACGFTDGDLEILYTKR
jgi:hypothetical protein